MQINIADEPTRGVVVRALWRMMDHAFSGGSCDDLFWPAGYVDESDEVLRVVRDDIDARFAWVAVMRGHVSAVEAARLGAQLDLEIDGAHLASELENLRDGVTESDAFFGASSQQRERLLGLYDAAGELMALLPEPAIRNWDDATAEVA
jgi:hypothetical protein